MQFRIVGAALVALALTSSAFGEDAQWTQLTNLPKGLNVAPGARLSILGIEPGASLSEVRPIAESLMAEGVPRQATQTPDGALLDKAGGVDTTPPLEERKAGIYLTTPGGDRISLDYTGEIDIDRDLAEWSQITDHISILFSAPSSGSQVLGVKRQIEYNDDNKQPRIAPMLDDMKARFGANPMVLNDGGPQTTYRWQFDDGAAVSKERPGRNDCFPYIGEVTEEKYIEEINRQGECDVVLEVTITTGISDDHAKALSFTMSDNERGRANLTTDFGFFRDYATKYQKDAGGAAPAL